MLKFGLLKFEPVEMNGPSYSALISHKNKKNYTRRRFLKNFRFSLRMDCTCCFCSTTDVAICCNSCNNCVCRSCWMDSQQQYYEFDYWQCNCCQQLSCDSCAVTDDGQASPEYGFTNVCRHCAVACDVCEKALSPLHLAHCTNCGNTGCEDCMYTCCSSL